MKKKLDEALKDIAKVGSNVEKIDAHTSEMVTTAGEMERRATDAKRNMANDNAMCCGCMPLKPGLTGLMWATFVSLVWLLLRDFYEIMFDSTFTGCITLVLHCSFYQVVLLFAKFKSDDCQLATEDEDPAINIKLMKMKYGGGLSCIALLVSFVLPWYTLFQIPVCGFYIYLVFVRYREG